jgi:signal transduction histidine kinase
VSLTASSRIDNGNIKVIEFMTAIPSMNSLKAIHAAPRRLIFMVIGALCIGLLASALFNSITLTRLRSYYLSNRGHEIVFSMDAQVRGSEKRHNTAVWQSVLEDSYETYSGSIAFLALLDGNGKTLAAAGQLPERFPEAAGTIMGNIYYFEEPMPRPRNPRNDAMHAAAGWRICVGLNTADTDFIKRMAYLQWIISGLAIVALIILSIYLVRMLNRFLELKAREATEAQLKSLGIMAASLAHEIRNPLGAMKGLTQLAQEELPAEHAAQKQLRTVVNEAERLEKLVTDLLDFAHAREPRVSEFNLEELLSDIRTILRSKLEASQVTLRLTIDPNSFHLRSDPSGLRQVLLNVLINAIDASPSGGDVVLAAMHKDHSKTLAIQIDDSGPGLGQRTSEQLFQPFATTKARGTGLGLAISKQIVESLGGSMKLENLPQQGARCSIMIPIR